MQVLTAEETLAAIEKATAPLVKEIAILKKLAAKNGDKIDTAEAIRISGIKEHRTLKKLFTYMQDGEKGKLFWSRVEIETWIASKELTKYTPLKVAV